MNLVGFIVGFRVSGVLMAQGPQAGRIINTSLLTLLSRIVHGIETDQ